MFGMNMPIGNSFMKNQAIKDCVGVVEDDDAVREALRLMLGALNMEVHAYASADGFLDDTDVRSRCACLVLDVRLPGISGIELHKQLLTQKRVPAIVFITGHGDIPMAVEAMRNGAVDFLQKPFREQQLLESVQKALVLERHARKAREECETTVARLACLTPKEHEVLEKLLVGLRSKEVAAEMGLATKTVEQHRANIMHKMHAATLAELISMCSSSR